MALSVAYKPHSIVFASGNHIRHIVNPRPSMNHSDITEYASGDVAPSFTGTHEAHPDFVWESSQIDDILSRCTTESIASDESAANVDIEYRKATNRGAREPTGGTDADHIRLRMTNNAFLSWQRLVAEQGQRALLTARLLPVYDGVNAPIITATDIVVATVQAFRDYFTLGPLSLNGSSVGGIKRGSWDNQIQYIEETADGEPYITFGGIDVAAPVFTFQGRNTTLFHTYKDGVALTNLTWYLRKKQGSGYNVPDGTAEHIKFTSSAGTIKARTIEAEDANVEVAVFMHNFSIDTASAIT